MPLRLVLLAPQGVVASAGRARLDILRDLCTFIGRMAARGVQVAIWSRHRMQLDGEDLDAYLTRESGVQIRHFRAATSRYPARQYRGSVDPILADLGVQRHETILVGSAETDMQAGVNNGLLLLRPAWYGDDITYGFRFTEIGRLARFCEIFALRQHPIYWSIDDGDLRVLSMGPFSTQIGDFAEFGADARRVAKDNLGDPKFWFLAVVSSLYFSGVAHQVDCICPFPGHDPASRGRTRDVLDQTMALFGKCFRKAYYPDLIVRHTKSRKSQYLQANQRTFTNQLNTIHLNRRPRAYDSVESRKTPIKLNGKRVLVVDDFITNGRSLDAARAYIEAAGGSAVLFSWLKTINSSFHHMQVAPALQPFAANAVPADPSAVTYGYAPNIVAPGAAQEIQRMLDSYRTWSWP